MVKENVLFHFWQSLAELIRNIDQARRDAVEDATSAWENLQTARARVVSFRSQIEANVVALDGVEREAAVGSRTVLDVLDAEQELLVCGDDAFGGWIAVIDPDMDRARRGANRDNRKQSPLYSNRLTHLSASGRRGLHPFARQLAGQQGCGHPGKDK